MDQSKTLARFADQSNGACAPAHPLDKLLAIVADDAPREPDLAETDILVHLLHIFGVEWTPSTTHLEEQDSE